MPTGDPYCPICQSMMRCIHMMPTYRWEDEEKAVYGVDALRKEFRQRLYGFDIFSNEEEDKNMDMTPQDMIQHTIEMAAHKERMKLSRAQELSQLAETSRRKTAATYRYSLVMFVREVTEQRASEGFNNLELNSRHLPWTPAEMEAVLPYLENDGFTVVLETEVEKRYTTSGVGIAGISSGLYIDPPSEMVPTNNKILKLSW